MAVVSAQVTVGASATLLHTATGTTRVYLQHEAGGSVRIGGSGVTFTTGYTLRGPSEIPYFELSDGESVYGVVDSGTSTVSVLAIN